MGGSAALQLVRDAGLDGLVRRGSEHALGEVGSERLLPVLPELRQLLPAGGLRRGATIGIDGSPGRLSPGQLSPGRSLPGESAPVATSLVLAMLAEASRAGSWCAVVGLPTLGVAAAAGLGISLERLALVPHPGPDWPTVVAALLDGFDIVVTASSGSGVPAPVIAGRLAARARQRGAVLMPYGPWPSVDLTIEARDPVWHGIEAGHGRLRGRQVTVVSRGRGAAAAPRLTHLWLPRPTSLIVDPVPADEPPVVGDTLATVHQLRSSWLTEVPGGAPAGDAGVPERAGGGR